MYVYFLSLGAPYKYGENNSYSWTLSLTILVLSCFGFGCWLFELIKKEKKKGTYSLC